MLLGINVRGFLCVFYFQGCMTILPTILFLITRVLKETAVKSADNQVPPPVSAALQGIKAIVTLPTVKTDETQKQWTGLIRSTLASILEYSQPGKWIPSAEMFMRTEFCCNGKAIIVFVYNLIGFMSNGCGSKVLVK